MIRAVEAKPGAGMQYQLDFEPAVLKHPGPINVHAMTLRSARLTSIPYQYRSFGKNSHAAIWVCACGKTMVGNVGGWQ